MGADCLHFRGTMCKGKHSSTVSVSSQHPAAAEKIVTVKGDERYEKVMAELAETRRQLRATAVSCEKTLTKTSNTLTMTRDTIEKVDTVKRELKEVIDKQAERLMTQFGALRPEKCLRRECDKWHGRNGDERWATPICVAKSDTLARKGYTTVDASEYVDTADVLHAKVAMLAEMIQRSRELTAYTGAGLSTSAGVADYASNAKGSLAAAQQKQKQKVSPKLARPTRAHCVLAALARRPEGPGQLKHIVQQNHDGLLQKATVPPHVVNEIHGSWFDARNVVVKMSGQLRADLVARMETTASKADLVLALGTSLSGMAADRVPFACAGRHSRGEGETLGLVIVSLQCTPRDDDAALRIFAKLDDVAELLAKQLDLTLPTEAEIKKATENPKLWYDYMYCSSNTTTTRETAEEMLARAHQQLPAIGRGGPEQEAGGVAQKRSHDLVMEAAVREAAAFKIQALLRRRQRT